jgi:hypothetical protein
VDPPSTGDLPPWGAPLFQQGVDKLQRSGSLAQQGKFTEASALMQQGMAEVDRAVSLAVSVSGVIRSERAHWFGRFSSPTSVPSLTARGS